MAIDKIKKVVFIIPSETYEKFLIELKNSACVEIIEQQIQKPLNEFLSVSYEQIKNLSSKIETAIAILQKYYKNETFVSATEIIFDNISSEIKEIETICEKIEQINKNINDLSSKINIIQSKLQTLSFFYGLDINFSLLTKCNTLSSFFIKAEAHIFEKLKKELKNFSFVYYWIHKKLKNELYVFLLIEKENETKFLNLVKKLEITLINILELLTTDSIETEIEKLSCELKNLYGFKEEETEKLINVAKENFEKIYTMYLKCLELLDFFNAQQNICSTQYTKIIYCWLPQKFYKKILSLLKKFPDVKTLFFEPEPNENTPTVLTNKPLTEPYEFITTLYGLPKQTEVDPTSFLAPFFTIFFALCLSDMFYGVLMLISYLLLRKKIKKTSLYYNLIVLFKYLGITSIIIGIFLGSVLGFSIIENFKILQKIVLLDPLNKPVDMLKFTFLLGLIQITFGLGISVVKNIKNKDILSAIDSLSWAVFIITFSPVVYKLFFPMDVPQNVVNIASKVAFWLFLFIVLFQSRNIKPIFLKPINFFVKAYNTIGYYADILSYSRILALALASTAIAQTINIFVTKLFHAQLLGIKYIEPVLAPIVFVFGHIFNFLISCLGGFVHSARLQYLEFFSKFFVSGGRPIKIFQPVRR